MYDEYQSIYPKALVAFAEEPGVLGTKAPELAAKFGEGKSLVQP
mgnify:CR=1 FL=1